MEQHCLCKSHFTCILCPATLSWQRTAEIAGQVTAQRLIMTDFLCNDNVIEQTVCDEHKGGTRIREGLELKCEQSGGIFFSQPSSPQAYTVDTLKRVLLPG